MSEENERIKLEASTKENNSILLEALQVVKQRRNTYNTPVNNFKRIAEFWTTALQHKLEKDNRVTEEDVALLMILVKVSRELHSSQRDNRVDIAGYADCLNIVAESRKKEPIVCCIT